VNRALEAVAGKRDAWITEGLWEGGDAGGFVEADETEAGGFVQTMLLSIGGEGWESNTWAERGQFSPERFGTTGPQKLVRLLYELRGGAPGPSVVLMIIAEASVAMFPLTTVTVCLDEGMRHYLNNPMFSFFSVQQYRQNFTGRDI
jgi:hypothetical protein